MVYLEEKRLEIDVSSETHKSEEKLLQFVIENNQHDKRLSGFKSKNEGKEAHN